MNAKNPRLTLTIGPGTAALLRRLSELTGTSQGGLVREILEESEPVFERLAVTLEAAADLKEKAATETAERMREAQRRIEESAGIALELFDDATGDLVKRAEGVRGRSRGGRLTPLSNRGVRFSRESGASPITARPAADSVSVKARRGKRAEKRGPNA